MSCILFGLILENANIANKAAFFYYFILVWLIVLSSQFCCWQQGNFWYQMITFKLLLLNFNGEKMVHFPPSSLLNMLKCITSEGFIWIIAIVRNATVEILHYRLPEAVLFSFQSNDMVPLFNLDYCWILSLDKNF